VDESSLQITPPKANVDIKRLGVPPVADELQNLRVIFKPFRELYEFYDIPSGHKFEIIK
jgi:hypothetical protein